MDIIKCEKGHFYDADVFSECPHCNQRINEEVSEESEDTKLVVGWLVCTSGEEFGQFYTLYNETNSVNGVSIVFNDELSRIYIDMAGSEVKPDLNNRELSENEYIYDHDKIRIKNNTYMVVELCRDGFSWKKKPVEERSNADMLKSMWKCNVCGVMNEETTNYCSVCGAERPQE